MDPDDYPSDSDESDEDFCIEKHVESASDAEYENDLPESDSDDGIDEPGMSTKAKKRKKNQKIPSKKQKIDDLTTNGNIAQDTTAVTNEEDDKEHADSLWASFLSDTGAAVNSQPVKKVESTTPKAEPKERKSKPSEEVIESKKEGKLTITEIFEYAGEEVKVTKEVDVIQSSSPSCSSKSVTTKGGSNLGTILNQLGKKNKISTIEKTKLDWNSFKRNEGLEEEIQTFNKGKDGYLERQDFLERADLRQFEIEKSLRQTGRRSNR